MTSLLFFAQTVQNCDPDKTDVASPGLCDTTLPMISANNDSLQIILQFAFGVIAAIALIIVLVASFLFITSRGNPEAVNKLRSTLIWAGVGLGVAVAAEAIVTFALGSLQ